MGGVPYASAVVIPQFAQTVLMLHGDLGRPCPLAGRPRDHRPHPDRRRADALLQTRCHRHRLFHHGRGAALFEHARAGDRLRHAGHDARAQTVGLAFLFVPISTVAYMTLPRRLNGDGAALFSMFRNVFGSIGISLATAMITQRTQVHQTHLSQWASPFNQPYQALIANYERRWCDGARRGGRAHDRGRTGLSGVPHPGASWPIRTCSFTRHRRLSRGSVSASCSRQRPAACGRSALMSNARTAAADWRLRLSALCGSARAAAFGRARISSRRIPICRHVLLRRQRDAAATAHLPAPTDPTGGTCSTIRR